MTAPVSIIEANFTRYKLTVSNKAPQGDFKKGHAKKLGSGHLTPSEAVWLDM